MTVQNILIVGGYGVVGSQIAQLLRQRYADVTILLGGRNPGQGQYLADQLGNIKLVQIDMAAADPLASVEAKVDIILCAVNDTGDHLMLSAIDRQIAYIDITRWTERMRASKNRAEALDTSQAPVVFASSWMAATVSVIARGLANEFEQVEKIDLNILYAGADKSGPNSVEYMDRLTLPFEVTKAGKTVTAHAFRRAQKVDFPATGKYRLYRFDTPDQFTLPTITGAQNVTSRIGFDDNVSGPMLSFLIRSGIWKMISGPRFKKIRHSLLHNPGDGAAHQIRLDIEGRKLDGKLEKQSWMITDPQGQTHLTALGAMIQLDRIIRSLQDDGRLHGVQIAEAVTGPDHAKAILTEGGASIVPLESA